MTAHRPLIVEDGLIARLGDGDTLLLPAVTAVRLLGVDHGKAVISISLSAFIKGTGAQTATVNDLPLASGASETFGKLTTHDTIAAISSGMATLYVSAGNRV
ncbi:hypothetical protein WCLP8_5170002 [uncultured Gammaproteobacteria bacterium]